MVGESLQSACFELVRQFVHNSITQKLEFSYKYADQLVLPPFMGEMGVEIQFYIAAVEPWLRTGWKALTKRPELYPTGSAIFDRKLFFELDTFAVRHKLRPIMCRLSADSIGQVSPMHSVEGSNHLLSVSCSDVALKTYIERCVIEKEFRAIVAKYILHADRPVTLWDRWLTSLHTPWDDFSSQVTSSALVPSFLPENFCNGFSRVGPHIGVQLRKYGDPSRNSNPAKVLPLVRRASQLLNVPVLVYGPDDGTFPIDGYPRTLSLVERGCTLLSTELSELSACKLMFAPDSGWADLMAWLTVPTIIEKVGNGTHQRLCVFKPVFLAINQIADFESEVLDLLTRGNRCVFSDRHSVMHPVYVPAGIKNREFL